jgi:hypothetical protein
MKPGAFELWANYTQQPYGPAWRSAGKGQWFCGWPVSWLSVKVTARCGTQPTSPGGRPAGSRSRQNSVCWIARCRMPVV